ncbi:hypothetical protein J3E68DRAFT_402481 [Trichoderma sp. SZMC 28012]
MQGSPLAAHPCLVFPFVPIFSYFLLAHNVITDYPRKSTIYRFFCILCNIKSCRNFAANPGSEKTKITAEWSLRKLRVALVARS